MMKTLPLNLLKSNYRMKKFDTLYRAFFFAEITETISAFGDLSDKVQLRKRVVVESMHNKNV